MNKTKVLFSEYVVPIFGICCHFFRFFLLFFCIFFVTLQKHYTFAADFDQRKLWTADGRAHKTPL